MAVRLKLTQWRLERNHTDATHWVQLLQDQLRLVSGIDKGIKQLGNALVYRVAGDTAQAKAFAEQGRNTIEPLRKAQPDNAFVAAALAVAYALLDEKGISPQRSAARNYAFAEQQRSAVWTRFRREPGIS